MKQGFEWRQWPQSHVYDHYTGVEGTVLCNGYDVKLGSTLLWKSACFGFLSYSIEVVIVISYLPQGAVSKINKVV